MSLSNDANTTLYRSTADKRRAVRMVLEAAPEWSDRRVADHVGVHHQMVAAERKATPQVDESSTCGPAPGKRTGKDGKTYTQVGPSRGAIGGGKSKANAPTPPAPEHIKPGTLAEGGFAVDASPVTPEEAAEAEAMAAESAPLLAAATGAGSGPCCGRP